MTELLKRKLSEADHHKVLDIAYALAFTVGLWQFTDYIRLIVSTGGSVPLATHLLGVQMFMLMVAGGLGYYWHVAGQVYKELAVAFPVIAGFSTLVIASYVSIFDIPVRDPYFINFGGLAAGLGLILIIEVGERIHKILIRRKQIKISQRVRQIPPTSNEIIEKKAAEIMTGLQKEG